MSSDDSEFVVIDEDFGQKITDSLQRLKEVQLMYKSAQDAHIQSNFLLQEKLDCALQLVLQRLPADFVSNTQDLINNVSQSLSTSSESILRNHVKHLCARLIAVDSNCENLSEQLKHAKTDIKPETTIQPKLNRLADVLREIDSLLPGGSADDSLNSGPGGNVDLCASAISNHSYAEDIDNLCTLVESLKERLKTALEKNVKDEVFELPQFADLQVSSSSLLKPKESSFAPRPPIYEIPVQQQPALDADAIACLVREKVATVLQQELQTIREQQADLLKSTLAASNANAASIKKEDTNSQKMMDLNAPQQPVTLRPPPAAVDAFIVNQPTASVSSSGIPPYPNLDDYTKNPVEIMPATRPPVFIDRYRFPPRTDPIDAQPSFTSEQNPVEIMPATRPPVFIDRYRFPPRTDPIDAQPSFTSEQNPVEIMPATRPPVFIDRYRFPPRTDPIDAQPSFTSEQENPLCPVCDVGFEDRVALELHLEANHL